MRLTSTSPVSAWTVFAVVGLASTGCNVVLGLGDYKEGGGGLGGATVVSSASGVTVGTANTSSTNASGTGGGGGKGSCIPGQQIACYNGPAGTENKGICHGGSEFCDQSGNPGPCQGDVEPAQAEICGNGLDDNCDGDVDENCDCTPNMTADCYSGPSATNGVGLCHGGTHTCNPDGHGFSACTGEVDPATENCATTADENCNNAEANGGIDTASGCVCLPTATQVCYDGAAGTEGVGNCKGGIQTCQADGLSWGSCAGEVIPTTEVCSTVGDEDCNGSGCSDTIWANGYNSGDITSFSTAFDSAGNVFIALNANGGSLAIGNTSLNNRFIIAKLDSLGAVKWVRGYGTGTTYGNQITGLVSDGTNLYFTGYAADVTTFGAYNLTGLFVAKIDNTGAEQWGHSCGGSNVEGGHVAVDASGNVYFTGGASGTVNCGGANLAGSSTYTDVIVAKVASNNTLVWAKRYSGTAASQGSGIGVDSTGNVYVDGGFSGTLSFGTPHTSAGGSDMFVVKLSPATPPVQTWSTFYGDGGNQSLVDLHLDSTGSPVIGGQFTSQVTIGGMTYGTANVIVPTALVAKLSSSGVAQWAKAFGSTLGGLTTDSQNHVVFGADAGSFGTNLGGGTISGTILAKLGSDGSYVWAKSYSGTPYFGQPAIGPSDVIAVPGFYNGIINVGTGPLPGSSGNESALIMEVGP